MHARYSFCPPLYRVSVQHDFVAKVTAPTLAVLIPLLTRALYDRRMEVQRQTVDNLVKLVRNPVFAANYLGPLVAGVDKIAESAPFLQVRGVYIGLLVAGRDRGSVLSQRALSRDRKSPLLFRHFDPQFIITHTGHPGMKDLRLAHVASHEIVEKTLFGLLHDLS